MDFADSQVFYTGSILSTGVSYATQKNPTDLSWRLPLALQLIPPIIIFTGAFLIPESPRWLVARGRSADATRVLAKYHGGGDANHPIVVLQIREFEDSIKLANTRSAFNYWGL